MPRPFRRRQRKAITSATLVAWILALFVGIAHACGLNEPSAASPEPVAAIASERAPDTGVPDGCEQFCSTNVPVVSKLPSLGDQPDAQPLIVADRDAGVSVMLPPTSALAQAAHPPPGVAAFLRFAHLRL